MSSQSTGNREDGRFPDSSYGNEGQGSYGVQPSDSSVTEGGYGGRQVREDQQEKM